MKHIMFIMTRLGGPGWGGAHKVSVMLANFLANAGYRVSFSVYEPGPVDYPIDPSIKIYYLSQLFSRPQLRPLYFIKKLFAFRRLCKQKTVDAVVGFTSNMAFYTVLACVFSKRKSLVSERTDPHVEPRSKFLRGIRNLIFCFADRVIFQTPGAKSYYPRLVQNKSEIIPNPISPVLPGAFNNTRDNRIVNFCRIAPQKNLKTLLEAFDLFFQNHKDYTLEIYGNAKDGDAYQRELLAFASSLPSGKNIHFLPACSDVHKKVISAKVFASSSDYEGLSNSMLEAMAIGLPVVVTDCQNGGERMCIENGKNGIIVPCRDPKAMARAISKIVDNEVLAATLSENAQHIKSRFSPVVVFNLWKHNFDTLLK